MKIREQKQYGKAVADYNKALEINPNYAEAYNNRGFVYFFRGDSIKALDDLEKAQKFGYKVNPELLKSVQEAQFKQVLNNAYINRSKLGR
jgi:tetratricopeptide (TPR) repeat protein